MTKKAKEVTKKKELFCILPSLAALFLYAAAMHDRMTAQGVGLYIAMQFQAENRTLYDLGADFVRLAVFLALLVLPCALLKRLRAPSLFRLLCAWLAFMPFVNAATMVHILFDLSEMASKQMPFADRFWHSAAPVLTVFQSWIPLLALFVLCGRLNKNTAEGHTICIPRRLLIFFLLVQLLMFVLLLALPGLGELWQLVFFYLLLVESFSLWEDICAKNTRWDRLSLVLFGLFLLRGVYRLLEILSTSTL